jgi:hypothetical protein
MTRREGTGHSRGTGRNRLTIRNKDPRLERDNLGLGDREIRAMEVENHGVRFFRRGVVSNRARRGGNR